MRQRKQANLRGGGLFRVLAAVAARLKQRRRAFPEKGRLLVGVVSALFLIAALPVPAAGLQTLDRSAPSAVRPVQTETAPAKPDSTQAQAQPQSWRSVLFPSNWRPPTETDAFESKKVLQDFSYAGYHNGDRPIPKPAGPIFDVTDFGADSSGTKNSTDEIQSAIAVCQDEGGGVVFFPAGRYRVVLPAGRSEVLRVSGSNVVLRGAGTDTTKLLNASVSMRNKALIRFRTPSGRFGGDRALITRDLLGPTKRIPVDQPQRFRIGDSVNVAWDPTAAWVREHNQQEFWGLGEGLTNTGKGNSYRTVTAVNVDEGYVEVNAPTRYYLKTRDNARLEILTPRIRECGIENISLGDQQTSVAGFSAEDTHRPKTGAYLCHGALLVEFRGARDCWMENVSSYQAAGNRSGCHMRSNALRLSHVFNMSVINCRFQYPQYGGPFGNGYMFTIAGCWESLFQNCDANHSRHGYALARLGTSGNVFHRCSDRNTKYQTGLSGAETTDGEGSDTHQHLSPSNLFDCCVFENSRLEFIHRRNISNRAALTAAHNVVWNFEANGERFPIGVVSDQGRYGYVIGTRGAGSSVRTKQSANTSGYFPVDHVEGVGDGALLAPQSLFQTQRLRRLKQAMASPEVMED